MPPSTTSSHTTSACSRPVCGRACWAFSIFTASAGRSATSSAATPVSGQTSGTSGVGGVPLSAATSASTVSVTGVAGSSPPHAVSASSAATSKTARAGPSPAPRPVLVTLDPPVGPGPEPRDSPSTDVRPGSPYGPAYADPVTRAVVPADLDDLVRSVGAALDGAGPAVAPVPLLPFRGAGRPGAVDLPPGTALVLRTSGSTGDPREVLLTAAAVRASGAATHERLGGPGHWLLTLPATHVAGVQVVARAHAAGRGLTAAPAGEPFTPRGFADLVARSPH